MGAPSIHWLFAACIQVVSTWRSLAKTPEELRECFTMRHGQSALLRFDSPARVRNEGLDVIISHLEIVLFQSSLNLNMSCNNLNI